MNPHEVRPLVDSEFRAAHELFRGALLEQPVTDESWAGYSGRYEPGRVLGAFVDGELVGTSMTTTNVLAVPGGRRLPVGAVTEVGVRADHTRRGVLTALMRAQFDEVRREVPDPLQRDEAPACDCSPGGGFVVATPRARASVRAREGRFTWSRRGA